MCNFLSYLTLFSKLIWFYSKYLLNYVQIDFLKFQYQTDIIYDGFLTLQILLNNVQVTFFKIFKS